MKEEQQKRLQGKVAVVTGASSGIGRGIALAMGREGAHVVINYHSHRETAEEVKNLIEEAGGKAVILHADVGHEAEAQQLIDTAIEHFGRLDILVNNAGIQQDSAFLEMTLEQWQRVIDTNLTFFMCQGSCQGVRKAGCAARALQSSRKHYLYQFSARRDSVGRPRQLYGGQRRHTNAYENFGAGAGQAQNTGKRHIAGSY